MKIIAEQAEKESPENFKSDEYFQVAYDILISLIKAAKNILPLGIDVSQEELDQMGFGQKKICLSKKILNYAENIYLETEFCDTKKWKVLSQNFRNLVPQDKDIRFNDEINDFSRQYKRYKSKLSNYQNLISYWTSLEPEFPCLSTLAKGLFVIAYTSTGVESLFSKCKVFKTPARNNLSVHNLEASLLIYQKVGDGNLDITPTMQMNFENMWKKPQEEVKEEQLISKTKRVIIPSKESVKKITESEETLLIELLSKRLGLGGSISKKEQERGETYVPSTGMKRIPEKLLDRKTFDEEFGEIDERKNFLE